MKNQSDLSKLMGYAGGYKYLTYASWVLSAISALAALLPFVYIWRVIKEILDVYPDYGAAQNLSRNGWLAMLSAAAAILMGTSINLLHGKSSIGSVICFVIRPCKTASITAV